MLTCFPAVQARHAADVARLEEAAAAAGAASKAAAAQHTEAQGRLQQQCNQLQVSTDQQAVCPCNAPAAKSCPICQHSIAHAQIACEASRQHA